MQGGKALFCRLFHLKLDIKGVVVGPAVDRHQHLVNLQRVGGVKDVVDRLGRPVEAVVGGLVGLVVVDAVQFVQQDVQLVEGLDVEVPGDDDIFALVGVHLQRQLIQLLGPPVGPEVV